VTDARHTLLAGAMSQRQPVSKRNDNDGPVGYAGPACPNPEDEVASNAATTRMKTGLQKRGVFRSKRGGGSRSGQHHSMQNGCVMTAGRD